MSEKSRAESERVLKKGSRFDKDSLQSAPSLSVDNPCPSEPSPLLSLTLTGSLQTGDGRGGTLFMGEVEVRVDPFLTTRQMPPAYP